MQLTLTHLITRALRRFPDRVAVQSGSTSATYHHLDALSNALAHGLRTMGVGRGTRVALYLRNCIEYVVSDIALLKLGAIKVPLNEYQTTSDVIYILADTGAAAIIAHRSLLDAMGGTVSEFAADTAIVCVQDEDGGTEPSSYPLWGEVLGPKSDVAAEVAAEDPALVSYTGGTTGKPKGVVQTQASLAINLFAHVVAGEICPDDVLLLTTPLPHSAGYHLQAALLQGSQVLLEQSFNARTFLDVIKSRQITWTFLVPTMIYRLLDQLAVHPGRTKLKTIVYGAAPMSPGRLREAIARFGYAFIQLYGQTECPNYITTLTRDDHRNPTLHGSCGKAVPFVELATTGANGREAGEVIVRAPYLLKEYLENPQATSTTLRNGWLHTGDIGYLDENGYLFLIDRAKDMIISGGMNVYSIEVEQVLKRHPCVADAAVIGVAHDDWGEQVQAVVVKQDRIEAGDLIDHCRRHLSKYKIPKSITFRSALPLTPYGKIDKKALRESLV